MLQLDTESSIRFPSITFCNLQICGFVEYDFNAYFNSYKQEEEKKQQNASNMLDEKLRRDKASSNLFLAKEIFLRRYEEKELTRLLNRNSTTLSDMLLDCKFDGDDCGELDFESFPMGEFQKCYKFNFDQKNVKRSRKYKRDHGLRMELFIGNPDKCKWVRERVQFY